MTFYEFIQWCFKDQNSGIATIIVLGVIFGGLVSIIKAIKGNSSTEEDGDD